MEIKKKKKVTKEQRFPSISLCCHHHDEQSKVARGQREINNNRIMSTSAPSSSSGGAKSSYLTNPVLAAKAKDVVDKLFASTSIDRTTFLLRSKETVPPTLEHYIAPMRLSKEEMVCRTFLADIAVAEAFNPNTTNVTFAPFPRSCEDVLELKPPEKIELHHVVVPKIFQPLPPKAPPKAPRVKSESASSRSRKRSYQASSLPEFAVDDDSRNMMKRSKPGTGEGDEEEDEPDDGEADQEPIHLHSTAPINLQAVLHDVFNEYWDMEFDDKVVHAFLAKISKLNCLDYGLTDFSSESCSLPVIKDKLKEGRYTTVEAFYYDFNLMFQNVLNYYPNDHPAYAKAFELSKHFELKWEATKALFKHA